MVTGDADADGLINNTDKNEWTLGAGESDYTPEDFNLDGEINNMDKTYWEQNIIYETYVPE